MTSREQAVAEVSAVIDKLVDQIDLSAMMRHRRKEFMNRLGIAMKQRMTFDEDGTAHIHITPDMQYHVFGDMDLCWLCGSGCTEHTKAMRRAAYLHDLPYMGELHVTKSVSR